MLITFTLLYWLIIRVNFGTALDNVALNKPAWLSSQVGTRHPWRAVDGRVLETDDNQCVTTEVETSPWWKVHLGTEYKIHYIVISTSGYANYYQRLADFEVRVGFVNGTGDFSENALCVFKSGYPPRQTASRFVCPQPLLGNVISVQRPNLSPADSLQFCELEAFDEEPLDNVALNKPAWLSSQVGTRHPWRAVDGRILETDDNKCVTTLQETSPWWKVDLEGEYRIRHVVISTSGYPNYYRRLANFEIRIGFVNGTGNFSENQLCVFKSGYPPRSTASTFVCPEPIVGNIISVQRPNLATPDNLQFCELQAWGRESLDNVALNKPAWLSSQVGTRHPWRAVDGRVLGRDDNLCVTTVKETSPWWKVDLEGEYKIHYVVISTSGTAPYHQRLADFEVRVGFVNGTGDFSGNAFCAFKSGHPPIQTASSFVCPQSLVGSVISVQRTNLATSDNLQFCELEAWDGAPLDNVALDKPAWLSSQVGTRHPWRAVDGRVLENHDDNCVTTEAETFPWWKVHLEGEFKIRHIVISTSGTAPYHQRLADFEVRVGFVNGTGNFSENQLCIFKGGYPPVGTASTFTCQEPIVGSVISVQRPNLVTPDYLQFCELQAWGRESTKTVPAAKKSLKKDKLIMHSSAINYDMIYPWHE